MTPTPAHPPVTPTTTLPILRWQLRSGARSLIGWSLGLIAVMVLYLPVFPSVQTPEVSDLINSLPQGIIDAMGLEMITSGAGYTQATYFNLLGFLIAAMACVTWGAQFIAGAEESGRLELTMSHAVSRTQYISESLGTLIVRVFVLCAVTVLGLLVMNGPAELSLNAGNIVVTTIAWGALAFLCGVTALTVGAVTGRQTWAVGAGAAVAVAAYAFDAVASSSTNFEWLSAISPYHWAFGNDPLATGDAWGGIGLLCGLSAVLFLVGLLVFRRRDLNA